MVLEFAMTVEWITGRKYEMLGLNGKASRYRKSAIAAPAEIELHHEVILTGTSRRLHVNIGDGMYRNYKLHPRTIVL